MDKVKRVLRLLFIAIPGGIHTIGHVLKSRALGVKCKVNFFKWGATETYTDPTPQQMREIALYGFGTEYALMVPLFILSIFSIGVYAFSIFYAFGAAWHWFTYPSNDQMISDFDSLCNHGIIPLTESEQHIEGTVGNTTTEEAK